MASLDDASDATSSASESSVEAVRLPKRKARASSSKRPKCTYYARKDEIQELQEQVKRLEEKLRGLEGPSRPPPVPADVMNLNAVLNASIEQHDVVLAATQSTLSALTLANAQGYARIPLTNRIHLPKDPEKRDAILKAMHEPKLRAASQYLLGRTSSLDIRIPHVQSERFDLPNGAAVVSGVDVTHFDGGHSLHQVFDAFVFFIKNQEITISEKLGMLTVRESDDLDSFKFGQNRLLMSIPEGVEVEANIVMFASCTEATETSKGYAVAAVDFVDQDDLYPYRPDLCARKEITAAIMLTEVFSDAGDPIVVMTRWVYTKIQPPSYPLDHKTTAAMRSALPMWCDVIPRAIRERLSVVSPTR